MDLDGYLAAMRALIAPTATEAGVYSDDLLTAGLRQALREYDESCAPVSAELTATAGRSQSLATVTDLVDLVAVIWPWLPAAGWTSIELARYVVRWRWTATAAIYIEDGEPADGDKLLVYYRARHKIASLDAAPATTVWPEHEALLALGAAGWAVELHYRQTSEAVKAPPTDQVKRMYTWSYLRLNEFHTGLRDLARVGLPIRPNWGHIGL